MLPSQSTPVSGLTRFDLPTVFSCAVELAEASSQLNQAEWGDLPIDLKPPGSVEHGRQITAARYQSRIRAEAGRLKRALGASGELQFHRDAKSDPPKWHDYGTQFDNTAHSQTVRLSLHKLALAAIDLSGFGTWVEIQWQMLETGNQLLRWGLAQLWAGMSVTERSTIRDQLQPPNEALGRLVNLTAEPPNYDGPQEIPEHLRYRIVRNYTSCYREYPNDLQTAMLNETAQNQAAFLRKATQMQFIEVAQRTAKSIPQFASASLDVYECNTDDAHREHMESYHKVFWGLACLRRAVEIPPRETWSETELAQRAELAGLAAILLQWIGGTNENRASLKESDVVAVLERFTTSTTQFKANLEQSMGVSERTNNESSASATLQPEKPPANTSNENATRALLRVFTNGVIDDRIKKAAQLLTNDNLTVEEKLTQIHALIPFPPTASAQILADMFGVTSTAVKKTNWWDQNRKGEKASEVGRRRDIHRERAKNYEAPSQDDDE